LLHNLISGLPEGLLVDLILINNIIWSILCLERILRGLFLDLLRIVPNSLVLVKKFRSSLICIHLTLLLPSNYFFLILSKLFLQFLLCTLSISKSSPPHQHLKPIPPCLIDDCLHGPLLYHDANLLLSPIVDTLKFEFVCIIGYQLISCLSDFLIYILRKEMLVSFIHNFSLLRTNRICRFVC
jgi:hypothetical protein